MTFVETILEEMVRLFKQHGIEVHSQEDIIKKLDIRPSTFHELFPNKKDMVRKVVLYDMERQRIEQQEHLSKAQNPVEELMTLLRDGIRDTKEMNIQYVIDLQQHYPEVWQIALDHLDSYSYPLVSEIINKGIVEGYLRKDINLQLVAKIIFEQLNMALNPVVFPPDRYNLSEVFRSIFLYYMRGICTDLGSKQAENFFSANDL